VESSTQKEGGLMVARLLGGEQMKTLTIKLSECIATPTDTTCSELLLSRYSFLNNSQFQKQQ